MKAELEKRLLDAAKTMNIPDSLINETTLRRSQ